MVRIYIICLSISLMTLLVGSCVNNKNNDDIDKTIGLNELSLKLIDSIRLEIDSKSSFELFDVYPISLDSVENGLIATNRLINGFNVYNLDNGKLINQISISADNSLGIRNLKTLIPISQDTLILLDDGNLNRIIFTDFNGYYLGNLRFKNVVNEPNLPPQISFTNFQSGSNNPLIFANNEIYLTTYPIFDFYKKENINSDINYQILLDLKDSSQRSIDMPLPKWKHGKVWNMISILLTRTFNENSKELVYGFYGEDSIRTVNIKNGNKSKHLARYPKRQDQTASFESKPNRDEIIEDGVETTLYPNILYDKYRDVYYRFVERPLNYNPDQHINYRAYYEKPISVLVLDSNFDLIGFSDLNKDTYTAYGAFVTSKGLYIPRLHPDYDQFSENWLDYSIYSLVKNED